MNGDDPIDSKLSELAEATAAVRPRPDFTARVLRAVSAQQTDFFRELVFSARRALPVAALVAAVSVVWAVQAESAADRAVAATYDVSEEDF